MDEVRYRTPQEVARQLEISPSSLRRWSDEFADHLSAEASSSQGKSHRRYTDADLDTLKTVKNLMSAGMTYEQVRQHLELQPATSNGEQTALVNPENLSMAMAFMAQAIDNITESHRSVLNSQQANRELMGVVIQDNFNLKEENARLRERMLELERHAAQARRDHELQAESMRQEFEMKLMEVREAVSQRSRITILQDRPGCLGSLFGGGAPTRIEAVPENRPRPAQRQAKPRRSYPVPPGPPE